MDIPVFDDNTSMRNQVDFYLEAVERGMCNVLSVPSVAGSRKPQGNENHDCTGVSAMHMSAMHM